MVEEGFSPIPLYEGKGIVWTINLFKESAKGSLRVMSIGSLKEFSKNHCKSPPPN